MAVVREAMVRAEVESTRSVAAVADAVTAGILLARRRGPAWVAGRESCAAVWLAP